MTTYLAASFEQRGYHATLEACRLISAALAPHAHVYPHGSVPGVASRDQPTETDLRLIGLRQLGGDGAIHQRCSELLAIDRCPTVDLQVDWALALGIRVRHIAPPLRAILLREGQRAEASLVGAPAVDLPPDDDCTFSGPVSVLRAFWGGAWHVCGTGAIDCSRVGGGGSYAAQDAQITAGLRIAVAAGIVRAAQRMADWDPRMLPLLRALYRDGHDLVDAGQEFDLGGRTPEQLAQRANRLRTRALGLIAAQLAERRAAARRAAAIA